MEDEPVNIREYEEVAKQVLPKMIFDFYNGGAGDEYTLRENMEAYKRIMLRPRILVDVGRIDMSTTLLGYKMQSPIMVAPTGMHKYAHPEGEVATARAAAACNTLMVLSFGSSRKIEDVASSCNAVRFYQLYVYQKREVSATLVRRAEEYGFKAILLTVDTPSLGRREKRHKKQKRGSDLEAFASQTLDPSLCWNDIEWLRSITSLPIILKGIISPEDGTFASLLFISGYQFYRFTKCFYFFLR
ncbi:Peroxisomal (S)-2-hydroxy-acid oxidase [Rhynchospora pubera]|uniref:Peroxisomal (S)-2-hydroxy-acid oxidase n=1 Tax=Rhynchospora pubera TaxID=906938 RepID=A0AAV8HHV5_9POAL|nr:Peroxisomal (S)-2-hydroxy-acid oxidase [Rhynchospora pubera]